MVVDWRLKAWRYNATMPRGFFRFLAALLLALTVPVQGMAAVTAGQCMSLGHHQGGAGQNSDAHELGADGHDHAAHSHDDGGITQYDEGGKASHCGPCAACCASASIAGPVGVTIPSSPSNTKYVFSQFPPPGFQPDGLDRPPLAL